MRLFSPVITGSLDITGSAAITGSLFVKSSTSDIFLVKNANDTTVLAISQSGVIILSRTPNKVGNNCLISVDDAFNVELYVQCLDE